MNIIEEKILGLLSAVAKDTGYNIVDLKIIGNKNKVLLILLEKENLEPITIDDCAKFSKEASVILDVNEAMTDRYTLEVSSAGINRPLIKKEDFERFKNKDVKIQTKIPINNQKVFKGYLLGITNNVISLKVGNEVMEIDFAMVYKANLEIIANTNLNDLSSSGKRGKNAKSK